MVLLCLAIAVFAVLDGHGHWPTATAIHAGFLPAPGSFDSLGAVRSQWHVYLSIPRDPAGHYPPTLSYVAVLEQHYELPGVLMSAIIIATVLCIPLTFRLCAALELSSAITVCAAALQVASVALFTFRR